MVRKICAIYIRGNNKVFKFQTISNEASVSFLILFPEIYSVSFSKCEFKMYKSVLIFIILSIYVKILVIYHKIFRCKCVLCDLFCRCECPKSYFIQFILYLLYYEITNNIKQCF